MGRDLFSKILKTRKPSHYDILDVKLFEADVQAIHQAGLAQMKKLKEWQLHPDADTANEVQEMLNQVSQAISTLENPEKKSAYDQQLAKELGVSAPGKGEKEKATPALGEAAELRPGRRIEPPSQSSLRVSPNVLSHGHDNKPGSDTIPGIIPDNPPPIPAAPSVLQQRMEAHRVRAETYAQGSGRSILGILIQAILILLLVGGVALAGFYGFRLINGTGNYQLSGEDFDKSQWRPFFDRNELLTLYFNHLEALKVVRKPYLKIHVEKSGLRDSRSKDIDYYDLNVVNPVNNQNVYTGRLSVVLSGRAEGSKQWAGIGNLARGTALAAIKSRLDNDPSLAVKLIEHMATTSSPEVAEDIVALLETLPESANAQIVPALTKKVRSANAPPALRLAALNAVRKLAEDSVKLDLLKEILGDAQAEIRTAAAQALAAIGPAATPILLDALAEGSTATKASVAAAFAKANTLPAGAIPTLRQMLQGNDESALVAALDALRQAQPPDSDLAATVFSLAEDAAQPQKVRDAALAASLCLYPDWTLQGSRSGTFRAIPGQASVATETKNFASEIRFLPDGSLMHRDNASRPWSTSSWTVANGQVQFLNNFSGTPQGRTTLTGSNSSNVTDNVTESCTWTATRSLSESLAQAPSPTPEEPTPTPELPSPTEPVVDTPPPQPEPEPAPPETKLDYAALIDRYRADAQAGNRVAAAICRFAEYAQGNYAAGEAFADPETGNEATERQMYEALPPFASEPFRTFIAGYCTYQGYGVGKDPAQAYAQFDTAAKAGFDPAQAALATCLIAGHGIARDVQRGEAIIQTLLLPDPDNRNLPHYPPAGLILGHFYRIGLGADIPKDLAKATEAYLAADTAGLAAAADAIRILFEEVKAEAKIRADKRLEAYLDDDDFAGRLAKERTAVVEKYGIAPASLTRDSFPPKTKIMAMLNQKLAAGLPESELAALRTVAEARYPLLKQGDKVAFDTSRWGRVSGTLDQITMQVAGTSRHIVGIVVDGRKIQLGEINADDRVKLDANKTESLRQEFVRNAQSGALREYREKTLAQLYRDNGYFEKDGEWICVDTVLPSVRREINERREAILRQQLQAYLTAELKRLGWAALGDSGLPLSGLPVKKQALYARAIALLDQGGLGDNPEATRLCRELNEFSETAKAVSGNNQDPDGFMLRLLSMVISRKMGRSDISPQVLARAQTALAGWNDKTPLPNSRETERALLPLVYHDYQRQCGLVDTEVTGAQDELQGLLGRQPPKMEISSGWSSFDVDVNTLEFRYENAGTVTAMINHEHLVEMQRSAYDLLEQLLKDYRLAQENIPRTRTYIQTLQRKREAMNPKLTYYQMRMRQFNCVDDGTSGNPAANNSARETPSAPTPHDFTGAAAKTLNGSVVKSEDNDALRLVTISMEQQGDQILMKSSIYEIEPDAIGNSLRKYVDQDVTVEGLVREFDGTPVIKVLKVHAQSQPPAPSAAKPQPKRKTRPLSDSAKAAEAAVLNLATAGQFTILFGKDSNGNRTVDGVIARYQAAKEAGAQFSEETEAAYAKLCRVANGGQ